MCDGPWGALANRVNVSLQLSSERTSPSPLSISLEEDIETSSASDFPTLEPVILRRGPKEEFRRHLQPSCQSDRIRRLRLSLALNPVPVEPRLHEVADRQAFRLEEDLDSGRDERVLRAQTGASEAILDAKIAPRKSILRTFREQFLLPTCRGRCRLNPNRSGIDVDQPAVSTLEFGSSVGRPGGSEVTHWVVD